MTTIDYIIGAVIISLLVLLISAINTILIATALYNSSQPKRRNSRNTRREERGYSNGNH